MNIITHLLSKIPYEDLPRTDVELPKREDRDNYKEADYPFRIIPEVFSAAAEMRDLPGPAGNVGKRHE